MPYFMNFMRIPKAGRIFEVLEAMKRTRAATGRPGNITVPVGSANQNNPRPGLISLVKTLKHVGKLPELISASPIRHL